MAVYAGFRDGTAYAVVGLPTSVVNVSTSSALTSAISSATPGQDIVLADGTYSGNFTMSGKTGSATSGIRIRAANRGKAVFSAGSSFTITNCAHVRVSGLAFPYDIPDLDLLQFRGASHHCRAERNLFGPTSQVSNIAAGNYVYVGDDCSHIYVDYNEIRFKGTSGNCIRVYGNFDTQLPCKYVRIAHNYIHDIGPEVGNDKECIRYGVSSMSKSPSYGVIERNVFARSKAEPEVISGKTNFLRVTGNILYQCAGGIVLRHGSDSIASDNYIIDGLNTTASAGLPSGGIRFYDRNHVVDYNYVSGTIGSDFQAALLFDSGDTTSTLNGHWNVVNCAARRNVLVNNATGIQVGDNYTTAPAGCTITDNVVANAISGAAVTYVGGFTAGGTGTVSNNSYSATPAGAGLTLASDGVYTKTGYGPRLTLLSATDVGPAGDLSELDGTGLDRASSGTTPADPTAGGFTAQIFVSPTGSDTNSGTSAASPKRTISAAITAASAGNTISVAAGTYSGNVIINKSGTAGNPITIRSATKWGAIVQGSNATSNEATFEVNGSYITIQDMTITGTSGSGVRHGVIVNADNVTIKGNHIYNICQFLTDGTSWLGGAGIDFWKANTANVLVEGNVIHDIGLRSSTQQLVHGIYVGVHGTNLRIQNNLIYECEDFGIHPYDATEASGIEIYNNTIASTGRGILQGPSGKTYNNIVYNVSGNSYDIRGSGNTGSNNYYGGTGSGPTGVSVGATSVSPQFVNPSTSGTPDFSLQSTSPLINAGTTTSAPTTDINGLTRTGNPDVGAYEYGATVPGGGGGGGGTGGGGTAILLPPDQLLHLGPNPSSTVGWNHFDLGAGLMSEHINYPQSSLDNSPPQGEPWWFSKYNDDGVPVVQFSAPLGGVTTSANTQYARMELREYEQNGTTKMAYDPTDGDHWIEGIYRVTGLTTAKPSVCVQQAHDPADDTIMVMTILSGGVVKLILRYNGTQVAVLDSNYTVGEEFYLKTRVNNGTPSIYYSSDPDTPSTTPITTSPSSSGFFSGAATGWYFKSGSYNNTNELTDPSFPDDEPVIKVEVRELKHWHSKSPLSSTPWPTPASYASSAIPTVNAGVDASVILGGATQSTFARTASENANGSTVTARQWAVTSGPSGVGNVLSTSVGVNWVPDGTTYIPGTYVLTYSATNANGTGTDTVTVTVSPSGTTDPGTPGTFPSFVSSGTPVFGSGNSVSVPAPPGVSSGMFQICVIQDAGIEDVASIPPNWFVLDTQDVDSGTGDTGGPASTMVFYNTTGDSASRTWTKSGARAWYAVRAAWKDYSSIGTHLPRASSLTATPYAPAVTPTTNNALVIGIGGWDRRNISAGPFTVPNGWSQRFNSTQNVVDVDIVEIETILIADVQAPNQQVTGANDPAGTGTGTSNFRSTIDDTGAMFSIVLEGSGAIVTGAGATLPAAPQLSVSTPIPALRALLTALPTLLVRSLFATGITLTAPTLLSINLPGLLPRVGMIVLPNLSFTGGGFKQFQFGGINFVVIPSLKAGSLPYRNPVLRTDYKYPAPNHPFRLIAQRILDGEIVEWELPVDEDFEYTEQLSGPVIMKGGFKPEIISVQELNLDGYAYWLHVEINEQIRASAILLPPQYRESAMEFSAEGISALPHYHIYDNVFQQIGVDPLSIVRTIWNFVQSQPQSDLGVTVSGNSSSVRLGEPARTETVDNGDGTTTIRDIEAKPYELVWWNATNCGEEIDTLSRETPFDYVERHVWNSDRTDVLHYFDMGYPRIGVARPELLFDEENILEVVPIQEGENTYASAVLVIGAGDGEDTIRGYAASSYGDRVRKEVVITDKTIDTRERAQALAFSELAMRKGSLFEISEIVVAAYHTNAPIGTYKVGDDIQVRVDIPWLFETHTAWYRITSISNKPSSDKVRLGLSRADLFNYSSTVEFIEEAAFIPTPPPESGPVTYAVYTTLLVSPFLTIGVPQAVRVAAINLVVGKTLSANAIGNTTLGGAITLTANKTLVVTGIATGALGGTSTLIVGSSLTVGIIAIRPGATTLSVVPTLVAGLTGTGPSAVNLVSSINFVATGITTRAGAVSLVVGKTLTANATVSGASGFGSTPFGSTPFGSDTVNSFVATPTLTVGAIQARQGSVSLASMPVLTTGNITTRQGAVSLSAGKTLTVGGRLVAQGTVSMVVGKTLSANGTIPISITQFGKTTDGSGSSTSSGNKTTVSKFTAATAGTVVAGHARLWLDTGTADIKVVVYADSSGVPGSILALSDATTISNTAEAVIDFTFSAGQQAALTAGTDYWIGHTWADPGTNIISWSRDTTTGGAQQNNSNAVTPFGTPTAASGPIDVYLDVSSTGGGGGGGGNATPLVDAVSPAIVTSPNASTLTTATFNAPANSLIVMCAHSDGTMDHSVTNNGVELAWIFIGQQRRATTGTGSAAAYVAPCPTARTGLTVTWNGSFPDDVAMKVYVITSGDLTDPVGAKVQGASTSNVLTTSALVSEKANSLGFIVADEFSDNGATTAATLSAFFPYDVSGRIAGGSGYKQLGTAGSSATLSMDAAGTAACDWNYVAFEIRGA